MLLDGVQIVAGGELLETEVRTALARGRFPARNPDQNVADLKAQLAANARGVVELERVIAALRNSYRRALHAARAAQRRSLRACRHRAAARWALHGRARRRRADLRRRQRRRDAAARDRRLHGHLARERGQLQRTDVDRARGRAVRVSDAGPREHSAQRRLPRAADDRAAAGQSARSPLSGRGRRRQRRDVAVHHRRPARRARRLRGGAKAR